MQGADNYFYSHNGDNDMFLTVDKEMLPVIGKPVAISFNVS